MKRWIPAVVLVLLTPAGFAVGAERNPARAATVERKSGPVLQVETLMNEVDTHKGLLRVEGVVSRVYPKDQMLALIDAAEFKHCGDVSCADLVLPVRWSGAAPEVKSLVRLEGELRKTGGKLEFVAQSLEKVPAK